MEPLLALADVHLGRKQTGDTKLGPGLDWALRAMEHAADAGCGHLVMLGDIIDRKRFSEHTYAEVDQFFRRGLELFDTVLFTAGNHDAHHTLTLPSGVTVAGPSPATYRAGGWALHTAAVEVDRDPRRLAGSFPAPIDATLNLGLLHSSVTGEYSNNPCLPCTTDELLSLGYDAWLLGHVHQPVTLSRHPFIGWVGMGRALTVSPGSAGGVVVRAIPADHAKVRSVGS